MLRRTHTGRSVSRAAAPWIGLVAAGGLVLAGAPSVAQAAPNAAPVAPAQLLAPVTTATATATVHFESGKSYLASYSQRILITLLRSLPAGATVASTKVVGYVQARTAWDNGRALGTARAVEVRTHLRALGLAGAISIASGGIAGASNLSRRAVVTITYRTPRTGVPQTVSFTQPEGMTVGDADLPLTASASSGLPVTLRSTTTGVCTVTGTLGAPMLHVVAAGTCALTATQPGSATYRAAAAVGRTVTMAPQPVSPPAVTYDVAFAGGTGVTDPDPQTYTEGGDPLVLPTPTRDGFTFDGWFTAAEGGSVVGHAGEDYTPTEDATLYAHWTAVSNDRTVTFHANYADAPQSTTQTADHSTALTANPFGATQGGLTFAGWATEAGGAVVYADGATYDFAANEDLYAVWGYPVRLYYDSWMDQEADDLYYCGRSDGNCTDANTTHVVLDRQVFQYDLVVFPNQSNDGPLGGFEIALDNSRWGVWINGSVAFDPALDANGRWYNGPAPVVRFDVTGSAMIEDGMA